MTQKTEAAGSCEKSVLSHLTTWCHVPHNSNLRKLQNIFSTSETGSKSVTCTKSFANTHLTWSHNPRKCVRRTALCHKPKFRKWCNKISLKQNVIRHTVVLQAFLNFLTMWYIWIQKNRSYSVLVCRNIAEDNLHITPNVCICSVTRIIETKGKSLKK